MAHNAASAAGQSGHFRGRHPACPPDGG
jgi:hypothetical protein